MPDPDNAYQYYWQSAVVNPPPPDEPELPPGTDYAVIAGELFRRVEAALKLLRANADPAEVISVINGVVTYTPGESLEAVTLNHIRRTLDACHGNKCAAARMLGITPRSVYNRVKKARGLDRIPYPGIPDNLKPKENDES